MSTSLCGNSYGCLTYMEDGTVGWTTDYVGERECGLCMGMAIAFVEFIIGEPIEFVTVFWEYEKKSKIQERLEGMLLYQLLKPEMEKIYG